VNEGITRIYNKIVSKIQNAPRGNEERFESVSEKREPFGEVEAGRGKRVLEGWDLGKRSCGAKNGLDIVLVFLFGIGCKSLIYGV
jgi:hypothetical protein